MMYKEILYFWKYINFFFDKEIILILKSIIYTKE